MKRGSIFLLIGIHSLLLISGCKPPSNKEKEIYFSHLARLTYTAHGGYSVVIPCDNDEIFVVTIHSLLVEYDFLKKAPQYKTFYEYLRAVVNTPGLYDCGKSGGYTYKNTEVYQDYLKIGFDAFMEKYTEAYLPELSDQENNEWTLKRDLVYEWGLDTAYETYAAVKIMFDHGNYIKQLGALEFIFVKTFKECRQPPPLPPDLPLPYEQ